MWRVCGAWWIGVFDRWVSWTISLCGGRAGVRAWWIGCTIGEVSQTDPGASIHPSIDPTDLEIDTPPFFLLFKQTPS